MKNPTLLAEKLLHNPTPPRDVKKYQLKCVNDSISVNHLKGCHN